MSNRPSWLCPTCGEDILRFGDDWFIRKQDSKSAKENRQYFRNYPHEERFHFTGFLHCENSKCKENVAVVGESGNAPNFRLGVSPFFIPHYFYPPLKVFQLSSKCPNDIKKEIQRSFSHYFSDPAASANALRTALEYLLNDLNKEILNNKGEPVKLSLHASIEVYGKNNSELANFLSAAKWIGNAGSHMEKISHDGLLDGYELIHHCIDELYEKPEKLKHLGDKAKEINDTRKPIKK